MHDAFVCPIISVCEERTPFWVRNFIYLDSKSVILRGDETSASSFVSTWLIDTTIAVFHFECSEFCSQCE